MPRSVWNGSISFGLVNIPVRLYPATSPKDPRFHQVDRRTGRRVRYRRVVDEPQPDTSVAPEEAEASPRAAPLPIEREVPYEDIVKGFEVGEGQHVVVEPEEVEALRPEPSRAIEIEHFVALEEIDPVYFEKSYHLAPAGETAAKPYTLLRLAMEEARRVAVGSFVLRTREHLVTIRPTRGILGLETLYYADEVRSPETAWQAGAAVNVSPAEVGLAVKLIEALAVDWDPSQYEDAYRQRVLELIGQREPQEAVEGEEGSRLPDLMDALKASVEALRGKARGAGGR